MILPLEHLFVGVPDLLRRIPDAESFDSLSRSRGALATELFLSMDAQVCTNGLHERERIGLLLVLVWIYRMRILGDKFVRVGDAKVR
jgi:hypothetical protein